MRKQPPAWLANWLERHQHPVSRWLHYFGIPLTILAVLDFAWIALMGWWGLWWHAPALLFAGYFLQWLGHVIEGNELGEVCLVKRLLGVPYVAISPRYAARRP